MNELSYPISRVAGVGAAIHDQLEAAGIINVAQLLHYFPRAYKDWTKITPISKLAYNQLQVISVEIASITQVRSKNKGMLLTTAVLRDDSGTIEAIWFNQPYLIKILKKDQKWLMLGKLNVRFGRRSFLPADRSTSAGVSPVYWRYRKVGTNMWRKIIGGCLNSINLEEHLSPEDVTQLGYITWDAAIRQIHQPQSIEDVEPARRRLFFDELLYEAIRSKLSRQQLERDQARQFSVEDEQLKEFAAQFGFILTNDQRKAAWEIILDLKKPHPMNRLLQGDVGSGKTAVALLASLVVLANKTSVVWLAPTEILAKQHFVTIAKYTASLGIECVLYTASHKDQITSDSPQLIVGTHALLYPTVQLPEIGLVVIDEQHRFGVTQRAVLKNKQQLFKTHFLSMTATPIPRSLALVRFGDLDISRLVAKPLNRASITTKLANEAQREQCFNHIKEEIAQGYQAFIVCPLIDEMADEESDELPLDFGEAQIKAAKVEFEALQKGPFQGFRLALLHGKQSASEKNRIMADYTDGKYDILVCTSVIEVGIDVPNATVIVIEGAERFGLAQLHQLRGRIGRSDLPSTCYLFTTSNSTDNQRLQMLVKSDNGFALAEADLKIRGVGELYGIKQSGIAKLRIANYDDIEILQKAQDYAESALKTGRIGEKTINLMRLLGYNEYLE